MFGSSNSFITYPSDIYWALTILLRLALYLKWVERGSPVEGMPRALATTSTVKLRAMDLSSGPRMVAVLRTGSYILRAKTTSVSSKSNLRVRTNISSPQPPR